jgi:hypothetical protein
VCYPSGALAVSYPIPLHVLMPVAFLFFLLITHRSISSTSPSGAFSRPGLLASSPLQSLCLSSIDSSSDVYNPPCSVPSVWAFQTHSSTVFAPIVPPVTSGSDPHGTRNVGRDRGLSGPQRHGLEPIRWSETWMSERTPKRTSEQSWMARVWIVTRTRTEVQTGSEGAGSDL